MNMKNAAVTFLAAVAALCLLLSLGVYCVKWVCFDESFYKTEYAKLGTAADIGMSEEDLMRTTNVLLSYLENKRDSLAVEAEINGVSREVFNDREKAHMVDVKNLYQGALVTAGACLIAALLLAALLIALNKGKRIREMLKGYLVGNAVFLAFLGGAGAYAALDFTSFWTGFHELFFTNDLWLLNPATDVMIMMYPEPFFFALVTKIVFLFGGIVVLGFVAAGVALAMLKRKGRYGKLRVSK